MEQTLAQAKAELRIAARGKGMNCQCCGRFTKFNVTPLNAGIANCLLFLYKYARTEFVHTPSHGDRKLLTVNSVGKLVYWGLAEFATSPTNPKKKRLGFWRISEKGAAFVEGRVKVAADVTVYKHKVLSINTDKLITIQDALKRPFDYTELMNTRADGKAN